LPCKPGDLPCKPGDLRCKPGELPSKLGELPCKPDVESRLRGYGVTRIRGYADPGAFHPATSSPRIPG
jgi:hypothetical protein